jgi:hypothetical protein
MPPAPAEDRPTPANDDRKARPPVRASRRSSPRPAASVRDCCGRTSRRPTIPRPLPRCGSGSIARTPRSLPHGYSVSAWCDACQHTVRLDLPALVAGGHGSVPLIHLPLRCRCGSDRFGVIVGAVSAGKWQPPGAEFTMTAVAAAGRCGKGAPIVRERGWWLWPDGADQRSGSELVHRSCPESATSSAGRVLTATAGGRSGSVQKRLSAVG